MKKIYQPRLKGLGWRLPDRLFSFEVFSSPEACEQWLEKRGFDRSSYHIDEYDEEDIEDYSIVC